jgi:hypothetical protein
MFDDDDDDDESFGNDYIFRAESTRHDEADLPKVYLPFMMIASLYTVMS